MEKLIAAFREELNVGLIKFGYKYNKGLDGYLLRTNSGWRMYQVLGLNRESYWELNPTILIRNNEVEDFFHKISGFDKQFQKGTSTIGIDLESYTNQNLRKDLRSRDEIPELILYYLEVFEKLAMPFFDEFEPVHKMKELVTSENGVSFAGPIFAGYKSVILCYLLNDEQLFSEQEKYNEYYKTFSQGFYNSEYQQLIALIES